MSSTECNMGLLVSGNVSKDENWLSVKHHSELFVGFSHLIDQPFEVNILPIFWR